MLLRLCLSVWTLWLSLSGDVLCWLLGLLELSNFGFIVSLFSNQPGVAGMV